MNKNFRNIITVAILITTLLFTYNCKNDNHTAEPIITQTVTFENIQSEATDEQTGTQINAREIQANSANLVSQINIPDGVTVTQHGHIYSKDAQGDDLIITDGVIISGKRPSQEKEGQIFKTELGVKTNSDPFTSNITQLDRGTTYYAKAYAIVNRQTIYSIQTNFTTPTFVSSNIENFRNITQTGASVTANITLLGSSLISDYGIVYGTEENVNIDNSNNTIIRLGGRAITGTYIVPLTNLISGTTYYVKAFAINDVGLSYSTEQNFTTLTPRHQHPNPIGATVEITNHSFIASTYGYDLALSGEITFIGSSNIIEHGFVISTYPNLEVGAVGTFTRRLGPKLSTGTFSGTIPGVNRNTTYYINAYAQNSEGIRYSEPLIITIPRIGYVEIPDDNFRNAILSCINTNGMTTLNGTDHRLFSCTENYNGTTTISGTEIRRDVLQSITYFSYGYRNSGVTNPNNIKIRSLSGVEEMVNLTTLRVVDNFLTNVDVSANTALGNLNFINNSLTNIDISNNTALGYIGFDNNSLTSIDLSNNTSLAIVGLLENALTSVDLAANTALWWLYINDNILTSIDLSTNTNLAFLTIDDNLLDNLDLSANTLLHTLVASNNDLTSLNISRNNLIRTLFIRGNPMLNCVQVDQSQLSGGANFITSLSKESRQTLSVTCP